MRRKFVLAMAIMGAFAVAYGCSERNGQTEALDKIIESDLKDGALQYIHDREANQCFAVFVQRGRGVAMTKVDCDEIPDDLLIEAYRKE
jgi:hypothetical protein